MPLLKGHQDDASRAIVPVLLALIALFLLMELAGTIDVVDGFGVSRAATGAASYTIPLNP